jgi:hypothetical protein
VILDPVKGGEGKHHVEPPAPLIRQLRRRRHLSPSACDHVMTLERPSSDTWE